MRGIFDEPSIRGTRRVLNVRRQRTVSLPKLFRAQRFHFGPSKSVSAISGRAAGLVFNCAAISSPKLASAGRGRASVMMRCHCSSPCNSGRRDDKSSASRSRSAGGSARIAASISCSVLMRKNKPCARRDGKRHFSAATLRAIDGTRQPRNEIAPHGVRSQTLSLGTSQIHHRSWKKFLSTTDALHPSARRWYILFCCFCLLSFGFGCGCGSCFLLLFGGCNLARSLGGAFSLTNLCRSLLRACVGISDSSSSI